MPASAKRVGILVQSFIEHFYLVAVHPHGLGGILTEFISVEAGGSAVVLLLGVGGVAVVGPEESFGPRVAPELHLPELLPRPVGVEVGRPDEGQVDSQRSAQYIIKLMTHITVS